MCTFIFHEVVLIVLYGAFFYQANAQNVTTEKPTGATNASLNPTTSTTSAPTTPNPTTSATSQPTTTPPLTTSVTSPSATTYSTTSATTAQPEPICKPTDPNAFVDDFLQRVRNQLPTISQLPNLQENFFQLSSGSIRNLNTLKRTADASVECGQDRALLTIPFTTSDALSTHYAWQHQFLPLVSGTSSSQIKSMKGKAMVAYKKTNGEAIVETLDISDLGQIDVQVKLGQFAVPDFFNTMTSKVTSVMMSFLKPMLQNKISSILKDALNQALVGIKL